MHHQVIQVLLVSQEMTELLGHQLLHTCLLCADEALNHHTADEDKQTLCRLYTSL